MTTETKIVDKLGLIEDYLWSLPIEEIVHIHSDKRFLIEDIMVRTEDEEELIEFYNDALKWKQELELAEVDKVVHEEILGGDKA